MALGPMLTDLLARYGLSSLTNWASQMIIEGKSPEEIELLLYDRPEFQAAFPEIEARRKQAEATGVFLRPISPDEILEYRSQARSMMRSYGLPPSFYGQNTDFFNLIVGDVSMDELNTRLDTVVTRVYTAPPDVRNVFNELFGTAADSALFNIFVDTKKALPVLEEMVQQAEAGGAGRRFGFDLTQSQMERIAGANISYSQAVEGFATLDQTRGLFDETIYEDVDLTAGEEGATAVFGLGPAGALTARAEARKAETEGSAGASAEREGVTSLGTAEQR